jgi:hypothetical protein
VPFLHSPSTLIADDSLSKADRVPWISTQVIITKPGDPLKGYTGVVTDVLPRQDTASGLRIEIQLLHFDPSSPYRKKIVDHDDVVEHRSVKDLYLQESILNMSFSSTGSPLLVYSEPRNVLFQPSKAYIKPACRPFGPPPQAGVSLAVSGGATPMPDRTSSLTPAWDPLSRSPGYSQFQFSIHRNLLPTKL